MNPNNLAELFLNPNDSASLCNISAEEGIFPNISNDVKIQVPSYVPEFNYDDTTPLVYSWLPIVSGYLDDDYDNLHNFSHVKLSDISDISDCPDEKKNLNEIPEVKIDEEIIQQKVESKIETIEYELENSCNAMDISLGHREEISVVSCDLSFNGKIHKLKEIFVEEDKPVSDEVNPIVDENALEDVTEEISEEERIRNESFEMLKKEDSTLMLMINEKSPEVLVNKDSDYEVDKENSECEEIETDLESEQQQHEPLENNKDDFSSTIRDEKLLRKLKAANTSSILPPPSKTQCTISLTEMLNSYKENIDKMLETVTKLETGSLFKSTCTIKESESLEWPKVTFINTLDIMYNRNQHTEFIEEERMKFCEKFVGTETASSFNFKVSHLSAKKKLEKIK
jgi:hypothetical protein